MLDCTLPSFSCHAVASGIPIRGGFRVVNAEHESSRFPYPYPSSNNISQNTDSAFITCPTPPFPCLQLPLSYPFVEAFRLSMSHSNFPFPYPKNTVSSTLTITTTLELHSVTLPMPAVAPVVSLCGGFPAVNAGHEPSQLPIQRVGCCAGTQLLQAGSCHPGG